MKIKQLEELDQEMKDLLDNFGYLFEEEKTVCIRLPSPLNCFDKDQSLITIENLSFGYKNKDNNIPIVLFNNVEFSIYPNSRIVLLGKNGSGKTSFLNILIGEEQNIPLIGSVKKYGGAKITMLQQHHYKGLILYYINLILY